MKKKMQDKEEERMVHNVEESGNKENTNDQVITDDKMDEARPVAEGEAVAAGSEGTETPADKVDSRVGAIEEKLAEMQDRYIRLSAEFDNYRKRTLKEKMELSKYAEENILSRIIPFMDDFERALIHIESSGENHALKNGIDLIYLKFSEFLKQNGIKEIESLGKDFDVDLHEAVAKVQVDDESKKGKVVDVALKGYYLHDKVLRFAKVVVGE